MRAIDITPFIDFVREGARGLWQIFVIIFPTILLAYALVEFEERNMWLHAFIDEHFGKKGFFAAVVGLFLLAVRRLPFGIRQKATVGVLVLIALAFLTSLLPPLPDM